MAPALSAGASPVVTRSPLQLLQYLDVVLVVLATPVALALGAPAFGLLIAAGAWLVQRLLAHTDRRWIARKREPGSRLGLDVAESFGRIWLLAGAIVVAGAVGGRADGLAAALTIFAAYSVAFATRMFSGREGFER
jgi:thiamine pyrophosphokinase